MIRKSDEMTGKRDVTRYRAASPFYLIGNYSFCSIMLSRIVPFLFMQDFSHKVQRLQGFRA